MFLKKKSGSLKETGKGHENVVFLLEIKFIHMVCPFPVITDIQTVLSLPVEPSLRWTLIERRSVTSRYHGSNIFGSKQ